MAVTYDTTVTSVTNSNNYYYLGSASSSSFGITLTNTTSSEGVAVWLRRRARISAGFTATFTYSTGTTPNGLVFVMQSLGSTARGGSGMNLGYSFARSIAIELDMFKDATGETNGNHVEVHSCWASSNSATTDCRIGTSTTLGSLITLASETPRTITVKYSPVTGTITASTVQSGATTTLASATISSTNFDLLFPDGNAYVGFTSSTSDSSTLAPALVQVSDFTMTTVGVSPALSRDSAAVYALTAEANNAVTTSTQRTFYLYDFCGTRINGASTEVATTVVTANDNAFGTTGSVSVASNDDGSYTISYYQSTVGTYVFSVYVNKTISGTSTFSRNYTLTVTSAAPSETLSEVVSGLPTNNVFTAGTSVNITVQLYDRFRNKYVGAAQSVKARFGCCDDFSYSSVNTATGLYTFTALTTTAALSSSLEFKVGGVNIKGSPYAITVNPGPVKGATSFLGGSGLTQTTVGVTSYIRLQLQDSYGNSITSPLDTPPELYLYSSVNGTATPIANDADTPGPTWRDTYYEYTYSTKVAKIYLIKCLVNGEVCRDSASLQTTVLAGQLDVTKTGITLPTSGLAAGSQQTVGIVPTDLYGNARGRENESNKTFDVTVTAAGGVATSVTCNSQGTDVKTTESVRSMRCFFHTSNQYRLTFTPLVATLSVGTSYSVVVTLGSQSTAASVLNIKPGTASAATSTFAVTDSGVAGQPVTATITAFDAEGNAAAPPESTINLILNSAGVIITPTRGTAIVTANKWTQDVTFYTKSTYTVTATLGGLIVGTAASVPIAAGALNLPTSTMFGDASGVINTDITLSFTPLDLYGNSVSDGVSGLACSVFVDASTSLPCAFGTIVADKPIPLTFTTPSTAGVNYQIKVSSGTDDWYGFLTGKSYDDGSQYGVILASGSTNPVSVLNLIAGTTVNYTLQNRDINGAVIPDAVSWSAVIYDSAGALAPTAVTVTIPTTPAASVTMTVKPRLAVTGFKVRIYANAAETKQSTDGISLNIAVGTMSYLYSTATLDASSGSAGVYTAGANVSYLVVPYDSEGNRVVTSSTITVAYVNSVDDTSVTVSSEWDSTNNIYKGSFTPTVAGRFTLVVQDPNHQTLLSEPVFTVAPAALSDKSTLATLAVCAIGESCSVVFTPRDKYNNPLTALTTSDFDLYTPSASASPSSKTSFTLETASENTFYVSFTPTYLDASYTNAIQAKVGAVVMASVSVTVTFAANLDATRTTATAIANLSAPGNAVITINAKDTYGNIWSAIPADYEFTLVDLTTNVSTVLGSSTYVADTTLGTMTVTYFVKTSSTSYSWVVRAKDVTLSIASTFAVRPGAPLATRTVQGSPASLTVQANDVFSFDITAYDQYGNRLDRADTSATFTIGIFEGRFACTGTSVLMPSELATSAWSATGNFTGTIGSSKITYTADGTYSVKISTTRANSFNAAGSRRRYYYYIMLNGVLIRSCDQLSDTVQVTPGVISGEHSLLTGVDLTAIEAGSSVALTVEYADKYKNQIRYTSDEVLPTVSLSTAGLFGCSGTELTGATITAGKDNAQLVFAPTKSGTMYSGIVVAGTSVKYSNSNCIPFIVHHSYPYTWTVSPAPLASGTLTEVPIVALDRFNNTVNLTQATTSSVNSFSFTIELTLTSSPDAAITTNAVVYSYSAASLTLVSGESNLKVPIAVLWPGTYAATVTIVESTVRERSYSSTTGSLTVDVGVCAQINAELPYRCPEGTCKVDASKCNGYSEELVFRCLTNATNNAYTYVSDIASCLCPTDQKLCTFHGLSYCTASTTACPTTTSPAVAAASQRHCNFGDSLCPDRRTCVSDPANCPDSTACASGTVPCPNGSCAKSGDECPSSISCPTDAPVLCADDSCAASATTCPSLRPCLPPREVRCADGSCVSKVADCPSAVVCPASTVLCASGFCAASVADCPAPFSCAAGFVRCSDGSCKADVSFCATKPSCPSGQVLCADGTSCATSATLCNSKPFCPTSRPVLCPSGACATAESLCGTAQTCPNDAPVRCADNSCAASASSCATTASQCPAQAPVRCPDGSCHKTANACASMIQCPVHRPLKCADSRCVATPLDCTAPSTLACPTGHVRCHSGMCAPFLLACPTVVTCADDEVRCPDGTCRATCDERAVDPPACPAGQVQCPLADAGVHCAAKLADCPTSFVCPKTAPVRCIDMTCASSVDECEPVDTNLIPATRMPCASGAWASSLSTCGTPITCPTAQPVKCWDESCRRVAADCPPMRRCDVDAPYLCADGSCQLNLWSCATARCTDSERPIRCPAFSSNRGCVASLSDCLDVEDLNANVLVQCPSGQRCWDGSCAAELRLCPARTCPRHMPVLCSTGACAESAAKCPNTNGCPWDTPYFCPGTASCVTSAAKCSSRSCSDGLTLCGDGTCRTRDACLGVTAFGCTSTTPIVCHDKKCAANTTTGVFDCTGTSDSYNACPASRPFRCDGGMCAVSSTRCPVTFASDSTGSCGTDSTGRAMPVRCDDGSCAYSLAQCPIIAPCADGYLRCPDNTCKALPCDPTRASCRDDATSAFNTQPFHGALCADVQTCPTARPYRCQDGRCAVSSSECVDEYPIVLQSCCADDLPYSRPTTSNPYGRCGSTAVAGGCTNPKRNADSVSGCPELYTRCASGICIASNSSLTCANYNTTSVSSCSASAPYTCPDGSCATSAADCLYNSNGCLASFPVLCSDGSCQASASSCSATTACANADHVRCSNGLCAESLSKCLMPETNCAMDTPIRCANGDCMAFAALAGASQQSLRCPPTLKCDARAPYLCADGTCVASESLCRPVMPCASGVRCPFTGACVSSISSCPATLSQCPAAAPFLCPNGACKTSSSDCAPALSTVRAASCPTSRPNRCADGSCASTPAQCVQVTVRAFASADFDVTASAVPSGVCANSGFICPNGLCVASSAECALVAACPLHATRCADGSCSTTTCPDNTSSCPSGSVRCEDGTCRASGSCPRFEGCPRASPYACYEKRVQCTTTADKCAAASSLEAGALPELDFHVTADDDDLDGQEVCAENCERSVAATSQTVITSGATDTTLDVSTNDNGVPRTQITVPSGAFSADTKLSVAPVTTLTSVNSTYHTSKVLSTPFTCSHTSVSTSASVTPSVQLVVTSHVDVQTFDGASSGSSAQNSTFSCELQGSWDAAVLSSSAVSGAMTEYTPKELRARVLRTHALRSMRTLDSSPCAGSITVNGSSVVINMDACANQFDITGTYASTESILPWSGESGEQKVSVRATASSVPGVAGKSVCLFVQRISDLLFVAFPADFGTATLTDEQLNTCVDSAVGVYITAVYIPNADPDAVDPCSKSALITDQVAKKDICLAKFNATNQWECIHSRDERIANPVWQTGMSNKQVSSALPACASASTAYTFIYEPLPAAPTVEEDTCDWWCEYGLIVIIVVSVVGGLMVIGVLFGIKVYRDRVAYKKEQDKIKALKAQAEDLNQYDGGIGRADADGEIVMVANPLVLQIKELQDELDRNHMNMEATAREEENTIQQLELQRQHIYDKLKQAQNALKSQEAASAPRAQRPAAYAPGVSSSGNSAPMLQSQSSVSLNSPMAASPAGMNRPLAPLESSSSGLQAQLNGPQMAPQRPVLNTPSAPVQPRRRDL